jgi:hypothetical protein
MNIPCFLGSVACEGSQYQQPNCWEKKWIIGTQVGWKFGNWTQEDLCGSVLCPCMAGNWDNCGTGVGSSLLVTRTIMYSWWLDMGTHCSLFLMAGHGHTLQIIAAGWTWAHAAHYPSWLEMGTHCRLFLLAGNGKTMQIIAAGWTWGHIAEYSCWLDIGTADYSY